LSKAARPTKAAAGVSLHGEEGDEGRNLVRVSTLYYQENRTQQEIADILGVSRFTVGRCLRRAREVGVVRIEIVSPDAAMLAVGSQVESALGIRLCVVATSAVGATSVEVRRQIGEAGARYLEGTVRDGQTIAVPWGRTLAELAAKLRPQARESITVSELVGGVARIVGGFAAHEVAARIAERLGGPCLFVQAPLIVDDVSTREVLLGEESIRRTLAVAERADIALLGVGAATPDLGLVAAGFVTPREIEVLASNGAVAHIGGWFVDRDGERHENGIAGRTVALGLDRVRKIPTKVVVAGGLEKVPGIIAAARGGLMDVLITDGTTAEAVVRTHRSS
jgi:DNA-binding transcriptional regulator LsrR (DeoR family)